MIRKYLSISNRRTLPSVFVLVGCLSLFLMLPSFAAASVSMTTYYSTGDRPQAIAFDGTNMWTGGYGGADKISPIGLITNYNTIPAILDIAFDGTNMWATHWGPIGSNRITKISPTGAMTIYYSPGVNQNIAFDGINMWTTNPNDNSVTKITPTGVMTTYPGTGSLPYGIAFDGTNMWITYWGSYSVTKITPTGVMTTYTGTTILGPYGLAFDGTNMWTTTPWGDSVTKITPTGVMTTYTGTGNFPFDISFDGTNMWTANFLDNSVTKITPTGAMTTYAGTGINPQHIAFDGTNMWTANYGDDSVTKISPSVTITVSSNNPSASWTITGPSGPPITGTGLSATYPAQPPGSYTIIWGAVPGYVTPPPGASDGTLPFFGNYTVAPTITANITYPSTSLTIPVGTLVSFAGAGSPFTGSPSVVGNYSAGSAPYGIAFDPSTGSIWVTTNDMSSLNKSTKLSVTTGGITGTNVGNFHANIAFDPTTNSMWAADPYQDTVTKFSAATGAVIGTYSTGLWPWGVAFDAFTNSIWVTNTNSGNITKLRTSDGFSLGTYGYSAVGQPYGVAFDSSTNSMWMTIPVLFSAVVKFNAANGAEVGTYSGGSPSSPFYIAFDPSTNSIWVTNGNYNNVAKLSAATGAILGTYTVGTQPLGVTFDPSTNSIWVANNASDSVTQLSAANGTVLGTYPTEADPRTLVFDSQTNSIWVTNRGSNSVTKISTGVDPATAYEWRDGNCTTGTLLSTSASFSTTLSAGSHTVYLRVQDSSGTWSTNCPSRVITVSGASPSDLKICPASSAVGNGFTTQLRAYYVATGTVNCADTSTATEVTDLLNWTSSNPGVATVNNTTQKGLITGNSIGVSTISTDTHLGSPSTPIVITVLCVPTGTCSDPGPSATAAVLCPATSFGIPDGCGGTVTCFGTRSCDFNWKEVGQ